MPDSAKSRIVDKKFEAELLAGSGHCEEIFISPLVGG